MKDVKRYNPSIEKGLSIEEVNERINNKLVNYDTSATTKSTKEIVRENIMTIFNMINIVLAIMIICVGSFKNLLFMLIIIANTGISIFQELRSKKTLDELKVVNATKIRTIRSGKEEEITLNEIVLDDIIKVEIGNQIVVDSIIKDGSVEVDESFITGEAETVFKKPGDMLLSGSFIVSGKAICQVEHIGMDNYTAKIASNTKYIKPISSEIMRSLNKVISTISFLIIPVGILLFCRQLYIQNNTVTEAVVNTVAALIGMIPEGLMLLTSTVLAVSVIRLAQRKVLVQDLYCIETLARVDTVCLDKTGTITEGAMEVVDVVTKDKVDIDEIVSNINYYVDDNNPTAKALKDKFGKNNTFKNVEAIPFSSSKKYSGIKVGKKSYLIGAAEFILKDDINDDLIEADKYSKDYRTIAVVEKTTKMKILGYILIQDKIRKEAPDTLRYFREQGVNLKIISGDNPSTVLGIAKRAGLKEDAVGIDANTLKSDEEIYEAAEKYDVFGRVTPDVKRKLVLALQKHGHIVAMTGDGVNDVMALKEADCSVAMASGSDATKNVSQLVLLDSNFASMPAIVGEGRRTINNIERSASLFLVKTIYATILAIIFIFIAMPYPFIPVQLTITSVVTIGIPSFVLALEPNNDRVKGRFLPTVLKKAFPPALTIVLNILVIYIAGHLFKLNTTQLSTLSVLITGYTSFMLLYKVCQPFNKIRKILFGSMLSAFIIGFFTLKKLFSFSHLTLPMIGIVIGCMILSTYLYKLMERITADSFQYLSKKRRTRLIKS
jgi:cation-transporting ATPase E